jgi:hypothetical protein
MGGLLVPVLDTFGSVGGSALDTGTRVDWRAYDADPVPRHRVEGLEASQLERHLRLELIEVTEALDRVGGQPFSATAARDLADAALGGRWGLPDGLPARAQRVIALAGTVAQICDAGLAGPDDARHRHVGKPPVPAAAPAAGGRPRPRRRHERRLRRSGRMAPSVRA